jgi:hypothetical protein
MNGAIMCGKTTHVPQRDDGELEVGGVDEARTVRSSIGYPAFL